MLRVTNYVRKGKKWKTVVAFEKLPREHPRHSKEGQEIAKFIHIVHAVNFAQGYAETHTARQKFKLIAIR